MSIDNADSIDFIGIDKETGHVILTITDHLDWTDSTHHLLLLQNKLNNYIRFCESGELYERYQDAKGRKITVRVAGKFTPSTDGVVFIARASSAMKKSGFAFEYRVHTNRDGDNV